MYGITGIYIYTWYMFLVGKPERDHQENLQVGGRIILKLIFQRNGEVVWTEFTWLRLGLVEGSCEHGNEPSGCIKCWEILE
jgi:hypothetical protein